MIIKSLKAREILDSRGMPTIEVVLQTEQGVFLSSVPSGASCGKYEAFELRDNDQRFFGKGVQKAICNIEKVIKPQIVSRQFSSQKEFDDLLIQLDKTENKSKLGANSLLAVSMAACRAFANEQKLPLYQYIREISQGQRADRGQPSGKFPEGCPRGALPRPCFNVLEGGRHAGNDLEIQEFMVVPMLGSFKDNLRAGAEIYYFLKIALVKAFGDTAINTGYEEGFAPPLKKTEQALEFLMLAIKQAGYENKVKIGIDAAGSEIYRNGKYKIHGKLIKPEKLLQYYLELFKKYPILFLEDPFSQDDIVSWRLFINHKSLIINHLVVGDDLTATNPQRIKMAKEQGLCNSVIIKPNQIGTVWETITAANLAKSFGWKIIVSHRAGETNDDFIADLAIGLGAEFIKAGAPAGGERVAKYNRLLEIEKELEKELSS